MTPLLTALLILVQVAGSVAILHLTDQLVPLLKHGAYDRSTCTFRPLTDSDGFDDLCGALATLALLTLLSWLLVLVAKGVLSILCEDHRHASAVVSLIVRGALALGWLVLAAAFTVALSQADEEEQAPAAYEAAGTPRMALNSPRLTTATSTTATTSSMLSGGNTFDRSTQRQIMVMLWILAAVALALAILAAASACCLLCCCCCCSPDSVVCLAGPCTALCCLCCQDVQGDSDSCCSPLCCAEMLCIGWLVRKLWQPDSHRGHCDHHHYHPYHPPMPPPPPIVVNGAGGYGQATVPGSGYGYAEGAALQQPLLAQQAGGYNTAAPWHSPSHLGQYQQYQQYVDPHYQPPVIQSSADMQHFYGRTWKGDTRSEKKG